MLKGDRVLLRPIERGDLPRLWELVGDFEVAVLGNPYAFDHLNMNRVMLQCLAEDPRAVGAYLKVGFVEEGRQRQLAWVRGRYEDVLVMSVLREEWKPRS